MSSRSFVVYRKKHGLVWWLLIGWWWRPITWFTRTFFAALLGFKITEKR